MRERERERERLAEREMMHNTENGRGREGPIVDSTVYVPHR